jgi:hypothetical protein
VTDPQDSIDLYRAARSEDKSLKIFEDGYHQLHIDNELLQMQKIVYDWCKLRIHRFNVYSKNFILLIYYIIKFRWNKS